MKEYVGVEVPQYSSCNLDCKYCLAKGTKILLYNYEEKNIEDIKVNDIVLAFEEYANKKRKQRKIKPSRVVRVFKRQDSVIEIETKSRLKIIVTKNHPLLARRGSSGRYSWRKAGDFKIGQLVNIYPKIKYKTPNIENINYKIGYFISIMSSDGSCNKYTNKKNINVYKIRVAMKDAEAIDRMEIFARFLDINLYCKPFRNYKKALFANRKSEFEKIQELITNNIQINNNLDYMAGFLSGIYDAEGSINKHGLIRISNTDIKIIKEIERCIRALQIPFIREECSGTKNHDISYRVRVLNSPELNFIKFIKSTMPAIERKSIKNIYGKCSITSDKIISIKSIGEKIVYNFETESHTYIANNFCVHNCYIPKNKILKKISDKWSERFASNEYFELLSGNYSNDQLECISLWGGEPSLGFKDLKDIESLFLKFPKIKSFSTSTNFTYFEGFKHLISNTNKVLESLDKKIKFDIQISLDGDEEQTDKNRGKGVYNKVLSNIDKLLNLIKESKNINFVVHPKATSVDEDLKKFVEEPETLIRFIKTFDDIDNKYREKTIKISNLDFSFKTLPTLALPGNYIREDGVNFFKYHLILKDILREKFPKWNYRDQYYNRLVELLNNAYVVNRFDGNATLFCSAGSSMLSLDPDGTTHGCHGTFWHNYKDYLNSNNSLVDWCSGERVVDYDEDKYWQVAKNYISEFRDSYNEARLKYVLSGFMHNIDNYLNITYGTIKMLAISEQINKIYKDDNWAKLFSYFIAFKSSCWMQNVMVTGSIFVTPLSIYKIYGNGVFEHTVRDLAKEIKFYDNAYDRD